MLKLIAVAAMMAMAAFLGCGGGGGSGNTGNTAPQFRGFDGDRALSLLTQQVNFGPRVPNTAAHTTTRDFIIAQLQQQTANVTRQDFSRTLGGTVFNFTNIIAVMPSATGLTQGKLVGKAKRQGAINRIMIAAHWDTRPVADFDPNPANRNTPIPGANDGASGVAVLLELARLLKATPARIPVELMFFDGEDFTRAVGESSEMFQGSTFFADNMGTFRPDAMILIDMIGDATLLVNRETNSLASAPALYNQVLGAATALGFGGNFNGPEMNISDDHLPLIARGVPSIDLIDFQFPDATHRYWHTLADTPDKCSAASLRVIGETLLRVVYAL